MRHSVSAVFLFLSVSASAAPMPEYLLDCNGALTLIDENRRPSIDEKEVNEVLKTHPMTEAEMATLGNPKAPGMRDYIGTPYYQGEFDLHGNKIHVRVIAKDGITQLTLMPAAASGFEEWQGAYQIYSSSNVGTFYTPADSKYLMGVISCSLKPVEARK